MVRVVASKKDGWSVWLRPESAGRREPPLSRARITEGAVELLDAEGIERLTMRRLAEHLGVGTTTLYWHVDTKDDVIDLAVDAVLGEAPVPSSPTDDWRADIVTLLTGWQETMLSHRWLAVLPSRQRPSLGPNHLAWMEFLRATLVRAGFTGRAVPAATWVLVSHVQGSATRQASVRWPAEEREAAQERLRANRDRYPTLAAQDHLLDDDWTENFALGLKYVLDGLAANLETN
ncbi:TetR/AcrR family transcriptional regulator C-terminal domain-containing protein [Kibdelosporangium lantanae]